MGSGLRAASSHIPCCVWRMSRENQTEVEGQRASQWNSTPQSCPCSYDNSLW